MNASELIALAKNILSESSEDKLELMEDYSSQIASWLASNDARLRQGMSEQERLELMELLSLHDSVMDKMAEMIGESSIALRKFKERSKAIRAYAGLNTSRISVFKSKKG